MFEDIKNVEIRNYNLRGAFGAISKRAETPFLYDYNSLAASGADLEKMKGTLVKDRMSAMRVMRYLTLKARPKLQTDLRLDESGKPFLWIFSD